MDDFNLAAWNNISPAFSNTAPYKVPTADDLSMFDSSGNVASGLGFGDYMKLGGTLIGAYGTLMAGDESQDAYNYNAELALTQGQFQEDNLSREEVSLLSTQRAMYAKAGVAMTGSPLDVAVNTASQIEMDKQIIQYNAQSSANMSRYKGQVAKGQSEIKAGETLLSGAGTLAMALML